jgi:8-oxo-dGTP pyrophosphatase MutT (NUDIX family)
MSSHPSPSDTPLRLRRRLTALPLPGRAAMEAMAPAGRGFMPIEEARASGCREACALVLLYPLGRAWHVVLTLRTAHLRDHSGQVSLPGGRLEADEDVVGGALREAWEELGVASDSVEVLGHLTPLHIPPSNFCLWPVLAVTPDRPRFAPQAEEVAEVIEWPVARLLDAA